MKRYSILQSDPVTGVLIKQAVHGTELPAGSVIDVLRNVTGFNVYQMDKFSVIDETGRVIGAERWMEAHAADFVRLEWQRGTSGQREAVRQLWPDLGLALDNHEVNNAEGAA